MSIFQDNSLAVDNPQSREEEEDLEEQRRREEEVSILTNFSNPNNTLLVVRSTGDWNTRI